MKEILRYRDPTHRHAIDEQCEHIRELDRIERTAIEESRAEIDSLEAEFTGVKREYDAKFEEAYEVWRERANPVWTWRLDGRGLRQDANAMWHCDDTPPNMLPRRARMRQFPSGPWL